MSPCIPIYTEQQASLLELGVCSHLQKMTRLATRSLGARPPAGAQSARPLSPCALPSILQADSEHGLRPQPSPAIFLESEAHGQAFAGLC